MDDFEVIDVNNKPVAAAVPAPEPVKLPQNFLILYLLWKNNAAIITSAAPSTTPSGDSTSPTYTNYNVPAYNPDLGSIFPPAGTNIYNTGGSCDCGTAQCGDIPDIAQNTQQTIIPLPSLNPQSSFNLSQLFATNWFTTRVHLSPLGKV